MKINLRLMQWTALFRQAALGRMLADGAISPDERRYHARTNGTPKQLAASLRLWEQIESTWSRIYTAALTGTPIY